MSDDDWTASLPDGLHTLESIKSGFLYINTSVSVIDNVDGGLDFPIVELVRKRTEG